MPQKISPVRPPRRRGFSLVLSLTLMAMLLLLCIGGAAILAVEMRVSRITIAHAKARLNALAGARIALGTLQGLAGPDKRITAPSSILDKAKGTWAAAEGIPQPRLTGVWRGRSVGGSYQSTHNESLLGWLTSGDTGKTQDEKLKHPEKTVNNRTGGLLMLSAPRSPDKGLEALTVTDPAEVYAIPENITDSSGGAAGQLAWWISDENTKANLSLRLPKTPPVPTLAEALEMGRNAPRFDLKLQGDGLFKDFPEDLPFKAPSVSRESIVFDTETPREPTNSWMARDARDHYHDITPYSESLLTDVVNGGLKYDLSLMLALDRLPDGYRDGGKVFPFYYDMESAPRLNGLQLAPAPVGLESKVPGAGTHAKAKGHWMVGTPAETLEPGSLPAFNQLDWTGWSDVWSYARIYRLAEPDFKDTNSNTPLFDSRTGLVITNSADLMCGAFYAGKTNTNTQNFLDRNAVNAVDMGNMTPWRTPIITAIQMSLSVRAKPNAATPTKNDLYLIVRPYLQLWNPYNVPLRFRNERFDSLVLNVRCLPGKLKVTTKDAAGTILESKEWNSWAFNGGGDRPIFNMFVSAPAESLNPLAPGEVRIYSPPTPSITTRATGSEGATQVTPGLRPLGGYEFPIPVNAFDGGATVALVPNDGPGVDANAVGPAKHISMDWMQGGNDGNEQRQCNGRGVRVDWNGNSEVALKIDPRETPVTKSQLNQPQGQAFARITMRLRSECDSTLRFPIFAYGDPLRQVYHPQSVGTFQSNPEMRLSPFEFCHSKINDDGDIIPGNPGLESSLANPNRGCAFTGHTAENGIDALVLSHIPLSPLGSIGELRDARLGGGVAYARLLQSIWDGHTDPNTGKAKLNVSTLLTGGRSVVQDAFGNSFGHPMIPSDKISASSSHSSENYYDFSWIMNSALWDAYCVTGLATQNSPVSVFAGKKFDKLADDFLLKGGQLANRRILFRDYGIGGEEIKKLLVKDDKPTDDAFAKATAAMTINGGFNINSTSVRAWRALLAGLNKATIAQIDANTPLANPTSASIDAPGVALRNPIPSGPLAEVNTGAYDKTFNSRRALAGRKLSEEQITELAQQIVMQVKLRGPFLSLGEFMNRQLEPTKGGNVGVLAEKGAIQAAIDTMKNAPINAFVKSSPVQQVTDADVSIFPNPGAVKGSQARGMPGVVCQADIVAPLATELTARSDTFVIRATGTSDDGASAHIEMVVRREVNYMDSSNEPYMLPDDPKFKPLNKTFGRRFKFVAIHWLKDETL